MTIRFALYERKWTELQCGEQIGAKVERKVKDHWQIVEQIDIDGKQHPGVSGHHRHLEK